MTQNELINIIENHKKWINGEANGKRADLSGADLSCADLRCADLSGADLSRAKGLLSSIDFIQKSFEHTEDGYIVYKAFNGIYESPESWNISENSVISETVNANRTNLCGCGINVAPLAWVKKEYPNAEIYKLLIKWEWLPGVVVPYNTDGKIRCEKAMIVGKVDERCLN